MKPLRGLTEHVLHTVKRLLQAVIIRVEPIITIYALYIPVFIQWIRKQKDESVLRRFILPILSICGAVFMVAACILGHGMACVWYLIVFAVFMLVGVLLNRKKTA